MILESKFLGVMGLGCNASLASRVMHACIDEVTSWQPVGLAVVWLFG